jgi:hypothetical protein
VRAVVDGQERSPVNLPTAPRANTWTDYAIPLRDLGALQGTLTGLKISAASAQRQVYIDCLRLE